MKLLSAALLALSLLALPIFLTCMLGIAAEREPAAALPHAEEVAEATEEGAPVIIGLEPHTPPPARRLAAA